MITPEISGTEPGGSKRVDWSAPRLLAGRSRGGRIAAGLLVLVAAITDTIAFKNTLGLVQLQSETSTWLMAAGATCMALVAAAALGTFLAVRRRDERNDFRLAAVVTAVPWIGLGLAMFLIRWLGPGGGTFSSPAPSPHPAPLVALFFAAIYFISGACTIFVAERLYNPEYFAYVRLTKRYERQARKVAEADATAERARAAVDHHDGELDREDHRRQAAIAARHALGAEAANYARLLMAAMLQDPAKTGLTETGPRPVPSPVIAVSRAAEIVGPEPRPDTDEDEQEELGETWPPASATSRAVRFNG